MLCGGFFSVVFAKVGRASGGPPLSSPLNSDDLMFILESGASLFVPPPYLFPMRGIIVIEAMHEREY